MASTTTTTLPFASSIPLNPKPTSKPRSLPTSTSHSAKFAFAAAAAANAREGRAIPEDSKNPHVLSGELRRLARLGRLPAALSLLDHLSHRGIPASTSAFSALLSSCRSLPLARHLHAHLRIHGLDTNEFLLAKLIQLYLTCGSPDDARLVLESMPASNSYVWNALLRGHVRRGGGNSFGAAADAFLAMRAAGASANEYTYSCLLKSLAGSARALAPAMATHALLFKNAFEGAPEMLMTGLMDVYFKFGRIKMAVKVFEEMPERDVVAWGAVIAGFAHKGLKTEALEHFRWMVDEGIEPNSVVVTSVVPVIAEVGARNLGQEIHGFVLKKFRDYTEFVSIHSALIDMYCKCGDMVSGRRVFYSTKDRNAVSWTALMSGYASNGRLDQALRSIIWMQREGVRPDVVAVATALPVCTQLKALREGKELHAYALKRWFLPNVSLATSLITMYAACGCLEYSRKVFDVMVTKTVRAWTALVDAYLRNGDHLSAVDVFRSMQLSKRRPDAIAITRMLSACGDVETFRLGKELHGQVLKLKMEPIPLVAAELVLMYGRCGDLKTAQRVFNRVQSKGSMTCTAIIEAYAFNHRYKEALNLFVWMLSNRFVPNNFTFDAMLKICGAAGLHDEALGIFDSMVREYNLKASEENYDCIIGLLTRAGRIREAQRFLARNHCKNWFQFYSLGKEEGIVVMGCLCSKGAKEDDDAASKKRTFSSKSLRRFLTPSRDPAAVASADAAAAGNDIGGTAALDAKPKENGVTSSPLLWYDGEKKVAVAFDLPRKSSGHQRRATMDVGINSAQNGSIVGGHANEAELGVVDVPKGFSGEHAVAGWPVWLTNVAPEAVQGWLPRRADSFEKLDKIGQGTYSSVYKARDLETGKIIALKKVRFVNMDPESVRFMAREIHILRRLDHPNVIKLEGIVTSRMSQSLYLVFEYMEHDLAGLAATPGLKFTEPQVKCFMQQLLSGLDHCHKNRVLHRDIKGSNLLIDSNGILKIADFGLATSYDPDKQQPLTSRVVTLWYRPPELLLGATEYGVAVDMWSTGCILAELLAGKPIMPGRTEVEQIHKIFKLCGSPSDEYWKTSKVPQTTMFKPQNQYRRCVAETFKDFPRSALVLLDSLLALEPEARGTADSALESEFFRTKPLACDPSSLPKFPPSKEYDAKLREEEARRQRNAALSGRGSESVRPGNENPKAKPAANSAAELQKRHAHANPKSNSEKFNPEDSVPGFRMEPPTLPSAMQAPGHESTWNNKGDYTDHRTIPGRTYSSVRVANAPHSRTQRSYMPQPGATDARSVANPRYNRLDAVEPTDQKQPLDRPASSHKKDLGVKDSTANYGGKNRRIHYSGPLIAPGGNIEDMLKEHERQIQQAVRKARLDKTNKDMF